MYGGVIWLTSGGSTERISQAKQYISGAISGMVLLLASYLILNTVSPDLVALQFPAILEVQKKEVLTTCCQTITGKYILREVIVEKNTCLKDEQPADMITCQQGFVAEKCQPLLEWKAGLRHLCYDYPQGYEAQIAENCPGDLKKTGCCCPPANVVKQNITCLKDCESYGESACNLAADSCGQECYFLNDKCVTF